MGRISASAKSHALPADVIAAVRAAADKKAEQLTLLDLRKAAGFTDADNAVIADPLSGGQGLAHRDSLLLRLVDELHDSSSVSDALWEELAALWTEPQLIELLMLAGWYHAISYTVHVGEHVHAGEVIGYVGTTGFSTGCHLHLMVWLDGRVVNPMTWF